MIYVTLNGKTVDILNGNSLSGIRAVNGIVKDSYVLDLRLCRRLLGKDAELDSGNRIIIVTEMSATANNIVLNSYVTGEGTLSPGVLCVYADSGTHYILEDIIVDINISGLAEKAARKVALAKIVIQLKPRKLGNVEYKGLVSYGITGKGSIKKKLTLTVVKSLDFKDLSRAKTGKCHMIVDLKGIANVGIVLSLSMRDTVGEIVTDGIAAIILCNDHVIVAVYVGSIVTLSDKLAVTHNKVA